MTALSASRSDIIEGDIAAIVARELDWQALSGRRVVVTGAGGFIGGYLVRTLLALHRLGKVALPVDVVALVREPERARRRFASDPDAGRIDWLHWDLNQFALPPLGEAHVVLHAASQASPRYYAVDPVGTMLPNTVGTAALLEAWRRCADPRGFLFVSSSEAYGAAADGEAWRETDTGRLDPLDARACYAESKRAGEALCMAWHRQHGLPTHIVRPFHTYGPGLRPDDGRVFADFAFNVARSEDIVIHSAGTARRAFCYISDAIAGVFSVLLSGQPGRCWNVANASAELSVLELAKLLAGLFPDRRLAIDRRVQGDAPVAADRIVPNTTRLESLGWRARVPPAEGFLRMIDAIHAWDPDVR